MRISSTGFPLGKSALETRRRIRKFSQTVLLAFLRCFLQQYGVFRCCRHFGHPVPTKIVNNYLFSIHSAIGRRENATLTHRNLQQLYVLHQPHLSTIFVLIVITLQLLSLNLYRL